MESRDQLDQVTPPRGYGQVPHRSTTCRDLRSAAEVASLDMAPTADAPSAAVISLSPLEPFKPDLYERAWASTPHPRLPLLATAHAKSVTVFSLTNFSAHSTLTGGHTRSVRSVAWRPATPPNSLSLVTASFDSTAGLWRWEGSANEHEVKSTTRDSHNHHGDDTSDEDASDWEFTLVLEGHDSEIKSVAFSPSGQFLATCSRDKSIWIWEDVGATEADDEWETVTVLKEHDGDVKAVAWCPDTNRKEPKGQYSSDCLASASYDNTVRIWREDRDGDWVCVAVLEGHDGTVWGLQWEPKPEQGRYPRLMTFSADATIRVWTMQDDELDQQGQRTPRHAPGSQFMSGFGGIPNTMRASIKEEWHCSAVLPKVHTQQIYAVSWSEMTGLVASTSSDGIIAVYREENVQAPEGEAEAAIELDGDVAPPDNHSPTPIAKTWKVVGLVNNAHGPYEVNHVIWCKRFDAGVAKKGEEEMLVSTGDDGVVRPWQISSPSSSQTSSS
ncbi:hypothetical protein MKZ38_002025 [Zalerion maritima]|uniref:Probable cytosolic iron-sulfur protein assembly protein 1 n=1 Tax=Zalerion maritima TaxID=339359 RepID=A0AAD5WSS3_9PEZI|nr:hypothetical protein MKZ38_002025 [Zalerion maritima]